MSVYNLEEVEKEQRTMEHMLDDDLRHGPEYGVHAAPAKYQAERMKRTDERLPKDIASKLAAKQHITEDVRDSNI